MALMSEISEETRLEWCPMFQSEVSKIVVKTIRYHVQQVQLLLQLHNFVFSLPLHSIQQRRNAGSSHNSSVGVLVPSLIPELRGSVVSGQEVHCNLVIMSDVGGRVIQVLFDDIGSVDLIRRGRDERGGGGVGRHSKRVMCEEVIAVD
jgi:hypothetical protein